jgi:uncharacterized glyoxalase superfamily protein PhnB
MLANRSMPSSTVIPELAYPDVGQAITWLCDAFGFTLRLRIANHRAQLNVGAGAVVLTEQLQADAKAQARSAAMVRVEDVNRHFARALRNGARVLQPPTDFCMANGSIVYWILRDTPGISLSHSPMSILWSGVAYPAN